MFSTCMNLAHKFLKSLDFLVLYKIELITPSIFMSCSEVK